MTPTNENASGWAIGNRKLAIVALCALTLGLSLTVARICIKYQVPEQGKFDHSRQGMCDFHNGVYYPTRALIDGVSPYGQTYADTNPVARQIPFFSPLILLLHLPFAVVPLRVGEILFVLFSFGILAAIAGLIAKAVGHEKRIDVMLSVAVMIVFSRGGHVTLFDGYFTLELILAVFLSIYWSGNDRPWLAGIALAVVSAKPTYILPLGFLLLARGNLRALVYGAILSVLGLVLPMAFLAWHEGGGDLGRGSEILVQQISETQQIHMAEEDEMPVNSWTRLDLLALVAKWIRTDPSQVIHVLTMVVVLTVPMFCIWRSRQKNPSLQKDDLVGPVGAIVLTAILVSVYHHAYDSLLLVAPIAGIVVGHSQWAGISRSYRILLGILMAFPLYNYGSTRMFLNRLSLNEGLVRVFTSVNAVAIFALLGLLCWKSLQSLQSRKSSHL